VHHGCYMGRRGRDAGVMRCREGIGVRAGNLFPYVLKGLCDTFLSSFQGTDRRRGHEARDRHLSRSPRTLINCLDSSSERGDLTGGSVLLEGEEEHAPPI